VPEPENVVRSGWFRRAIGRVTGWLKPVVGLRDGVLVVGAGLYGLGYMAWALYAWAQGLGPLPVLSTQYVLAGATIGIFLGMAWIVINGLWMGRSRLHAWLETPTELRLTVRWLLVFARDLTVFVTSLSMLLCYAFMAHIGQWLFPIGLLFASPILIFLATDIKERPRWMRADYGQMPWPFRFLNLRIVGNILTPPFIVLPWFAMFSILYEIFLSIIIPSVFLAFGVVTFIKLPQALGAAGASCVHLDMDRTMMSKEARQELLADQGTSDIKVARTIPLDLMFAGGNSVLVRRHDPQPSKDRPIYTIGSNLVASTVDCE
jgi:hypothetical protein